VVTVKANKVVDPLSSVSAYPSSLLLGLPNTPVTHTAPAHQATQQEGPLDDVGQQGMPTNQPVENKTTKVSLPSSGVSLSSAEVFSKFSSVEVLSERQKEYRSLNHQTSSAKFQDQWSMTWF